MIPTVGEVYPRRLGGHPFGAGCLVLAAAAALAGCGDPRPLGPAELRTRASAECARANARTEALPRSLAFPRDTVALVTLLAATEPISRDLVGRLGALTPPERDRRAWGRLLRDLRAQVRSLGDLRRAALRGEAAAVARAAQAIAAPGARATALGLGLAECARNVEPSG